MGLVVRCCQGTDGLGCTDHSLGETDISDMVDYLADRIADESEIRRGKLFPYQYFAAFRNDTNRLAKGYPICARNLLPPHDGMMCAAMVVSNLIDVRL